MKKLKLGALAVFAIAVTAGLVYKNLPQRGQHIPADLRDAVADDSGFNTEIPDFDAEAPDVSKSQLGYVSPHGIPSQQHIPPMPPVKPPKPSDTSTPSTEAGVDSDPIMDALRQFYVDDLHRTPAQAIARRYMRGSGKPLMFEDVVGQWEGERYEIRRNGSEVMKQVALSIIGDGSKAYSTEAAMGSALGSVCELAASLKPRNLKPVRGSTEVNLLTLWNDPLTFLPKVKNYAMHDGDLIRAELRGNDVSAITLYRKCR